MKYSHFNTFDIVYTMYDQSYVSEMVDLRGSKASVQA